MYIERYVTVLLQNDKFYIYRITCIWKIVIIIIRLNMKKTMRFLRLDCNCGCSKKILREKFVELREAFQALSRPEQDIFLMAQLKAMNGGEITASRYLKKKRVLIRELFIIEIATHLFTRKRISIC